MYAMEEGDTHNSKSSGNCFIRQLDEYKYDMMICQSVVSVIEGKSKKRKERV